MEQRFLGSSAHRGVFLPHVFVLVASIGALTQPEKLGKKKPWRGKQPGAFKPVPRVKAESLPEAPSKAEADVFHH